MERRRLENAIVRREILDTYLEEEGVIELAMALEIIEGVIDPEARRKAQAAE